MHIRNPQVRQWLRDRMEPSPNRPELDLRKKRRIILKLNAAELFETFLTPTTSAQKRFSLEGGEMLIPLLDAVIERSGRHGVQGDRAGDAAPGPAQRPGQHPEQALRDDLRASSRTTCPRPSRGDGDVKYHLGFSADHVTADGQTIHLSLTPNPSHLEAVNPVVEGRMRAKQRRFKDQDRKLGVPILIHGDAAFAGQGLVAETLNLSQLPGYRTGGTVHIVVNNQIGFTTAPVDSRSTRYCTDVAKMIEVPIFHVNGEDPEAVVYVAELALDFRETFGQDVVIDMVCYRRHGHNEGDEPAFTQPLMYGKIRDRPTVRALYTEPADRTASCRRKRPRRSPRPSATRCRRSTTRSTTTSPPRSPAPGVRRPWKGFTPAYSFDPVETGVPATLRGRSPTALARSPRGSTLNPKIERTHRRPGQAIDGGGRSTGRSARCSPSARCCSKGRPSASAARTAAGAPSATATPCWSTDQTAETTPRSTPCPEQAELCVFDSLLSEAAVLGFDYGYSLDEPNMLILWEAQFGDFANGAQVIIDQFIASAESKWGRASGLVMLLPHGYEGQGPEHSSGPARTVPAALRRGQHPGRQRRPPPRSTSTSSAARSAATSASR